MTKVADAFHRLSVLIETPASLTFFITLVLTSFSHIANVFQIWSMLQPVAKIFETLYVGLAELTCLWFPSSPYQSCKQGEEETEYSISQASVTSNEERSVFPRSVSILLQILLICKLYKAIGIWANQKGRNTVNEYNMCTR